MSIKPRKLSLLWIEDIAPSQLRNDTVHTFGLTVTQYSRWREFVEKLINGEHLQIPAFDLLAIDCKFNLDKTSPAYPVPDPVYEELPELCWSEKLGFQNSGILMGATLAGLRSASAMPVSAALYTGDSSWTNDAPSLMLASQIFALCGARVPRSPDKPKTALRKLNTKSTEDLLTDVANLVKHGPRSCSEALPQTLVNYRAGLLERLGFDDEQTRAISIWADSRSLGQLLNVFTSTTSVEELDKCLSEHGLVLYDNDGQHTCLDVRSLFCDLRIQYDEAQLPRTVGNVVSLASVKEPDGPIYKFIWKLSEDIRVRTKEVYDFLELVIDESANKSVAEVFRGDHFRQLMALLFAFTNEYYVRRSTEPVVGEITLKSVAGKLGFRVEGAETYDGQIKRILKNNDLPEDLLDRLVGGGKLPLHLLMLCQDYVLESKLHTGNAAWPPFLDG